MRTRLSMKVRTHKCQQILAISFHSFFWESDHKQMYNLEFGQLSNREASLRGKITKPIFDRTSHDIKFLWFRHLREFCTDTYGEEPTRNMRVSLLRCTTPTAHRSVPIDPISAKQQSRAAIEISTVQNWPGMVLQPACRDVASASIRAYIY